MASPHHVQGRRPRQLHKNECVPPNLKTRLKNVILQRLTTELRRHLHTHLPKTIIVLPSLILRTS